MYCTSIVLLLYLNISIFRDFTFLSLHFRDKYCAFFLDYMYLPSSAYSKDLHLHEVNMACMVKIIIFFFFSSAHLINFPSGGSATLVKYFSLWHFLLVFPLHLRELLHFFASVFIGLNSSFLSCLLSFTPFYTYSGLEGQNATFHKTTFHKTQITLFVP